MYLDLYTLKNSRAEPLLISGTEISKSVRLFPSSSVTIEVTSQSVSDTLKIIFAQAEIKLVLGASSAIRWRDYQDRQTELELRQEPRGRVTRFTKPFIIVNALPEALHIFQEPNTCERMIRPGRQLEFYREGGYATDFPSLEWQPLIVVVENWMPEPEDTDG
jgi:hypothetical protein